MPIPQTVPAEVKGHISIAGLDPQRQSVAQLAARVGLVFQNGGMCSPAASCRAPSFGRRAAAGGHRRHPDHRGRGGAGGAGD